MADNNEGRIKATTAVAATNKDPNDSASDASSEDSRSDVLENEYDEQSSQKRARRKKKTPPRPA